MFKSVLISFLEIKSLVSLKNKYLHFAFLDEGTFQWGGVKFSKVLRRVAHKGGL